MITGAASGIGRGIAVAFAREGAHIVVADRVDESAAAVVLNEIAEAGTRGLFVRTDVSDEASVRHMADVALREFGRVDILVNNAGIFTESLLEDMSVEDWDRVVNTNLRGTFLCTRVLIGQMLARRDGRIINIASVVGQSGNPGQANYVASKAGLLGLTKSLAQELASRNITVNAVAPGFIETDMTNVLKDEHKARITQAIPMGRIGRAEEVAAAVRFLASDEASYITGNVIDVNGGMYM